MADGVGAIVLGPALGWVVGKVLDEVLKAFQCLKNASLNVQKLRDLLERSETSVKDLSSVPNAAHPAGKWLTALRAQLEAAGDVANDWSVISQDFSVAVRSYKRYRTSKRSLRICSHIRDLLTEASTQHWASHLAFHRVLAKNDEKILDKFGEVREREEHMLHDIANLMTRAELKGEFSKLEQASSALNLDRLSGLGSSGTKPLEDTASKVSEVDVTFGGDALLDELRRHMLEGEYNKWVGLLGMGGIGKTFTARRIFDDPQIWQHFSDGVHWVTVSKEQPGPYQMCKTLMEAVRGAMVISQMPKDLQSAKSRLRDFLEDKRVLLILDDVWKDIDNDGVDVLHHLDVVSEEKKSVILVTTRDKGVLECSGRVSQMFEVPILSEDDSWQLFCWHAFHRRGCPIPPELQSVAKDVAKECRGLPLALEVIGSTMGDIQLSADRRALGLSLRVMWQHALVHLRDASLGNDDYKRLLHSLQMSVDSLHDWQLKECFYYFAAFPEDYDVDADKLINIWVAEGLLENDVSASVEFSAEEEGKILLSCLVAKSMLQMKEHDCFGEGPRITFRVHDVMRDVARHNLKMNAVTQEEIPVSARKCLYAPGLKLSTIPMAWTMSGVKLEAKRLSMVWNDLRHFPGSKPFYADNLHVLMLTENRSLEYLSGIFFQRLTYLRVLDLSSTGIKSIPDGVLRELAFLVLLDLRWCRSLEEISDEVSALQSLEFLMLKGCWTITKLPRVSELTHMRCFSTYVPSRLVSDYDGQIKDNNEDMEALNDGKISLRSKGVDKVERRQAMEEGDEEGEKAPQRKLAKQEAPYSCLPFELPTSLRELHLDRAHSSFDKDRDSEYSFDISCLSALEKLQLDELVSYPAGMESLHHLKHLKMRMWPVVPFPRLGRLTKLERLEVRLFPGCGGLQSYFDSDTFPSLEYLSIEGRTLTADNFIFLPGIMPNLKFFNLDLLDETPLVASIAELQSLRRLQLTFYIDQREIRQSLLSQLPCLPNLEELRIRDWFFSKEVRDMLPTQILEREQEGKLSLVIIR